MGEEVTNEEAVAAPSDPIVSPDLAPPSPTLPPDANGNPAAVFDPDAFKEQQRKAATTQIWNNMVEAEAQVRVAVIDPSVITATTPQGQDVQGVTTDTAAAEKSHKEKAEEATRLRAVATSMLTGNGVDELNLLRARIGELANRKSRFQQELAQWEEFRDHPDAYGYVLLDGKTKIEPEVAVASCKVLEAALTDCTAELEWYIACRDQPAA